MRYLFMGTPPFAARVLELLSAEVGAPTAVITQPARPAGRGQRLAPTAVQEFATQKAWPFFATENTNDPEFLETLRSLQPDLILVAAFGQILKKALLALPAKYCLNVHASLLPKYRGAAPVARSILDGDLETGITIQKMARKLDTGDILVQRTIPIAPFDTSATLLDKLAELGGACLIEAVRTIEAGREVFVAQDESLATHAAKLSKDESPIDWTRSAAEVRRKVYGLQPWPTAETLLGNEVMRVFGAHEVDDPIDGEPGTVRTDHRTFVHVRCGDGRALALTEIQLANRKKLLISSFLSAYRGHFPFARIGAL